MLIVREVLDLLLGIYLYILIGRLIFEWILVFARQWKPQGVILVIAEAIYTVTDPPLKAIRKVVPPLRLGGVALDLAFLILIVVVSILRAIV